MSDCLQSGLQLVTAVTAQAKESVAGHTLRVNPRKHGLTIADFAEGQNDVLFVRLNVFEPMHGEHPPIGGESAGLDKVY